MNPIIPEETESHAEGGNQLPGVEEDFKDLSSTIDSIVSPLVIDRDCVEREDAFEPTDYGEGTIDCVLPLHPEDDQTHRVKYLDDKPRLVQPTLMIRATGALSDMVIFPMGFVYLIMTSMVFNACTKVRHTWRAIPGSIQQWWKWAVMGVFIAMIMAAIGIHAGEDSEPTRSGAMFPDMEWYTRDEDYINRRVDEHRTRNISCISKGLQLYSQIHTFVAFDKLGNRYRVGVDSYESISRKDPHKLAIMLFSFKSLYHPGMCLGTTHDHFRAPGAPGGHSKCT